ncbi:putative protein disulfide-isomerase A4 isoform X2 [Tubulanus polymorphus]|uniref:putative protein disulfide-isomerase A4 isoform X2 n=1 Tax=Tubulanus polymorphus TaxID=672921 RepID=UPI003DA3C8D4
MTVSTRFWLCFGCLMVIGWIAAVNGQAQVPMVEPIRINVNDPEFNEEAKEDDVNYDHEPAEVLEEDDVIVLTKDNFDEVVAKNKILLVEFYAPWCGHCKSLKPEYAKAAEELKKNDPPVRLGMVDATVHSELASKFEVSGYPTLKLYKDGKWLDYDGPRDKDGIVKYMKERADPNWKPPPDAVVELTKETFKDFINNNELSLVEFYAPWCGHCKRLAPVYEKAAQKLKTNDPPIPLAKLDASSESEIGSEYGVSGYPTLKVFRKGKPFDYKGERDEYGIYDYMKKQVGDASLEVTSVKEIKSKSPEDDILVIGFFEEKSSTLYEIFQNAANTLRDDVICLHTFSAAVRATFNVKPGSIAVIPANRFHTKHEKTQYVLNKADVTMDDIVKFIRDHQTPLIGQLTDQNMEKRYMSRPLCLLFYTVDFSFSHRDATQMWRKKFADIAKDYPKITFAIADEDGQSKLFKDLKLDESGEELNVGCLGNKDKKFPMEPMEEYDSDHIREFLTDFQKGKLKAIVKSQPIPKKQTGPVVTIVGKSFNKIVLDQSKDVLVEFYAPWCGHCKSFEPTYKKLAKKLSGSEPNLVLAKIDGTANDAPSEFEVTGFPTIYFVPAAETKPVKYEGNRDSDDLVEFMKKHATASFKKSKDEL